MCRKIAGALAVCLAVGAAASQQGASQTSPETTSPRPTPPTVYYAAAGVTAPALIPPNLGITAPKHCSNLNGMVGLSVVVDSAGVPRDFKILRSDGPRLSDFATKFIAEQRFKPGTYGGIPVDVASELTVALQTCVSGTKESGDVENNELTLRSHPLIAIALLAQPMASADNGGGAPVIGASSVSDSTTVLNKLGERISAPIPLYNPQAVYSPYGKKARIEGICLIGLIVDANGLPKNIHVIKGLEPSLDQKAIEAVEKYRFKPAMKDGAVPVPVMINVEVNFQLY
jgi:TonB family protein